MRESEIRFKSGEIELAGTIAMPDGAGPYPAVLFICGSGKIDRNENHKKMPLNVFYDISHFLAGKGIASLRYDKRGVGQSGGDFLSSGFNDNAGDAKAALQFMKKQKDMLPGKIFLLGHSEGAFLSCKLAGEASGAAGAILLAGGAVSGEAVLKWQALQVVKGMKGLNAWIIKTFRVDVAKAQQKQLDIIKQSKKDWFRIQLAKINAKWFREFMAYDPSAADLQRITVPVLAITGSKDIQVNPADLERMAQMIKAPFEYHLIPDMTHALRLEQGEASVSKYAEEIKKPVELALLEMILSWLKKQI